MEDEYGDEEAEKDSNDTITNVIEIGIGRASRVHDRHGLSAPSRVKLP